VAERARRLTEILQPTQFPPIYGDSLLGSCKSLIDPMVYIARCALKGRYRDSPFQLIVHDWPNAGRDPHLCEPGGFPDQHADDGRVLGRAFDEADAQDRLLRYVQDEWKIKPNFIANLGLRYEFKTFFLSVSAGRFPSTSTLAAATAHLVGISPFRIRTISRPVSVLLGHPEVCMIER